MKSPAPCDTRERGFALIRALRAGLPGSGGGGGQHGATHFFG